MSEEIVPPASGQECIGANDLASMIRSARKSPEEVSAMIGTKKEHATVPIMKPPGKGKFWRVRGGQDWSYQENTFLMLPADFDCNRREFHLIRPQLEGFVMSKPQLRAAVKTFGLAFMVDLFGSPGYWALNLADAGNWGTSARNIVEELKSEWGMVISESGRYVCLRPEGDLPKPQWPDGDPICCLTKAFKERVIDSEDHPELKKLLGRT